MGCTGSYADKLSWNLDLIVGADATVTGSTWRNFNEQFDRR